MTFKGSGSEDPVSGLVMADDISPILKQRLLTSGIPSQKDEKIYRAYLSGKSIDEIARRHNYKQTHVRDIIHFVQRWSNAQVSEDIQKLRKQQAEYYNHIRRESLLAWERSKRPKVTKRKGTSAGGQNGDTSYEDTTTQETVGDVQFLRAALQALAKVDDLFGLDAPKKTALTNAAGNGDPKVLHGHLIKNVGKMSDEDLQKVIEIGEQVDKLVLAKQQEEQES